MLLPERQYGLSYCNVKLVNIVNTVEAISIIENHFVEKNTLNKLLI